MNIGCYIDPLKGYPDILTVGEVAKILRINPIQVRERSRSGDLPAFKVGSLWRYPKRWLVAYMVGYAAPKTGYPDTSTTEAGTTVLATSS